MLDRLFELVRLAVDHAGFTFQARALFSQAVLDDVFDAGIDLDQTGGWDGLRFKRLSAHSTPLRRDGLGTPLPIDCIFAR